MSAVRLTLVILAAFSSGMLMSSIITLDTAPLETHSLTMTLCDSGGRRPCP